MITIISPSSSVSRSFVSNLTHATYLNFVKFKSKFVKKIVVMMTLLRLLGVGSTISSESDRQHTKKQEERSE